MAFATTGLLSMIYCEAGGELGSEQLQPALIDDWKTVGTMGSPLLGREDMRKRANC
jgi:hypothetical protein